MGDKDFGDKDFEDFLNNQDDEDDDGMPECQKRLLFEIIQTKLGNSTDLIMAVSELYTKDPKDEYRIWLRELQGVSKQAFDQLDYLMTVILEEIEPPDTL